MMRPVGPGGGEPGAKSPAVAVEAGPQGSRSVGSPVVASAN